MHPAPKSTMWTSFPITCANSANTSCPKNTNPNFQHYLFDQNECRKFIKNNFEYWTSGKVLDLEYKTDCHTFDAVRRELPLKYNNLCNSMEY